MEPTRQQILLLGAPLRGVNREITRAIGLSQAKIEHYVIHLLLTIMVAKITTHYAT